MAFIRKKSTQSEPSTTRSSRSERENIRHGFTPKALRHIASIHGIPTSPLEIHKLVEHLGIKLLCIPMDDDISGSLRMSDSGNHWVLTVNSLHHPNRQRFTIAHELAHFSLHTSTASDFIDHNFFRNGDSNPMEAEANKFASELLMPETEFRKYVSDFAGSIEALSKFFKVSTLAVRVRAKTLGMQGHGL